MELRIICAIEYYTFATLTADYKLSIARLFPDVTPLLMVLYMALVSILCLAHISSE